MSEQGYVYVRSGDPRGPVVVGVDGSGTDGAAVAWAALAAARHHVPLHLLHSTEVAGAGPADDDSSQEETLEVLRAQGRVPRVVDELLRKARQDHPDVEVVATETAGPASSALLQHQGSALMLVVGTGRRGGLGERIVGSTSLNIAMHASCPVVVVNPGVDVEVASTGRLAVGVDGSRDSAAAAEVAWRAAAARGVAVRVVTTWYLEVVRGIVVTEADSPEYQQIEDRQRERVEVATRAARAAHPEVPFEVQVVNGPSSKALAAVSEEADVLVLGTRGRGGFAGKLLGSISHKVLQAAHCPVVLVKSRPQE